ncbi:unnamed protein product, partial [Prorocentrum cordatum]
ALRERDLREAASAESLRRQREESGAALREAQAQVASLVCEVQELEAHNAQLQAALAAPGGAASC